MTGKSTISSGILLEYVGSITFQATMSAMILLMEEMGRSPPGMYKRL